MPNLRLYEKLKVGDEIRILNNVVTQEEVTGKVIDIDKNRIMTVAWETGDCGLFNEVSAYILQVNGKPVKEITG